MISPSQSRARSCRAFTLVELLVASVVLLIILLMLVAMVNSTATIWRTSSAKVEQFRAARTAFESINRHLSQATLNPYFGYQYNANTGLPQRYSRQSDLRFITASTQKLVPQKPSGDKPPMPGPGHSVFFMAPVGFASSDDQTVNPDTGVPMYTTADNLLNTWGYFIEYSSDYNYRPPFLNVANSGYKPPPERYRYRLMEFMLPSDQITIYRQTSSNNNQTYTGHDWFDAFLALSAAPPTSTQDTSQTQVRPAHLLAENIISLVIFPQLSPKDQASVTAEQGGGLLAPGYTYDSAYDRSKGGTKPLTAAQRRTDTYNQLPPVVQITMIAMDETSAARQEDAKTRNNVQADQPPSNLQTITDQYFKSADPTDPKGDVDPQSANFATQYPQDLAAIQKALVNEHITFRVFTTSISLRAAKWSQD